MCSNKLVENLECYMEDLVECFEDYVKKSLVVISFGVGLIVAMLIYLLKVVYDRPPIQNILAENAVSAQNQIRNMTNLEEENIFHKLTQKEKSVCCEETRSEKITTGVNTTRIHGMPSYEEEVLRDIGFSSYFQPGCRRRINDNSLPSRVPIPSLTTSPPKYKSIHSMRLSKPHISSLKLCSRPDQDSCCSVCCNDTENR